MGMDEARCSFCNKPADAVEALIQPPPSLKGRGEVYICTECIRACAAILDSDSGEMLLRMSKETVQ
jgi:ATP-dependent protease Clp ATPase subunit